ncbi:MAG: hypothetical protein DRP73_04670 [Candidatus Omnitrophota bacterium]|nr:MAG: hypothetical protein DRP73_04670 [Candidatus Omnitrophota bacterium]
MALELEIRYLEGEKFEIKSLKSGAKAYIDIRREEGYIPSTPNSSELFLASIGGCVMYYARLYLVNAGIKFDKLKVRVAGEWTKQPVLMLKDIKVKISTDAELGDRKQAFLRFVHNCPVHNTIINTKEIKIEMEE